MKSKISRTKTKKGIREAIIERLLKESISFDEGTFEERGEHESITKEIQSNKTESVYKTKVFF